MAAEFMKNCRLFVFGVLLLVLSGTLHVQAYASVETTEYSVGIEDGSYAALPSGYLADAADLNALIEEDAAAEEVVGAGSVIGASVTGKIRYDITYGFFDLLNSYRSQHGVKSLTMDRKLLQHAQMRAAQLFALYDHSQPDGSSCFAGLSHAGGEIIFVIPEGNAQSFFNGFKSSPSHNSVMLGRDFSVCGVGVVELSSG